MTDQAPQVPWILGTEKAIARSLAVVLVKERGGTWAKLTPRQRDNVIDEAVEIVRGWVAAKSARTFLAEWREPL